MPVDSKHPDFLRYWDEWRRCTDCMTGTTAVKGRDVLALPQQPGGRDQPGYMNLASHGTAYLPRPSGMSAYDYSSYKTRACWFNASARVRQGLIGLIFREQPDIVAPDLILGQIKDVTRTGVALEAFAQHLTASHLTTGRIGLLIDLPEGDVLANQVQPQWTLFRAEHIINWRPLQLPTGAVAYGQVVIEEDIDTPDPQDPYKHLVIKQWRELVLEDGVYVVKLWRKIQQASGEGFMLWDQRIPTRRGRPLDFLPFEILNADSLDHVLASPPLLDVVDVNLSHYRTSADYEHELHMTSLATPYITGYDATESEFKIGSLTAWILPGDHVQVGFLEVSGNGLAAKLEKLKHAEAEMAVLGARLLEPQRKSIEAAETHQIRQSAELSIMEAYANAASTVLTKALRWHAWWAGATEQLNDETINVALNTDFLPTKLDAPTLTALVASWQAGALTQEDLYFNLMQGSLLEPGVTFEDWQKKLAQQAVLPLLVGPPGRNGAGVRNGHADVGQGGNGAGVPPDPAMGQGGTGPNMGQLNG